MNGNVSWVCTLCRTQQMKCFIRVFSWKAHPAVEVQKWRRGHPGTLLVPLRDRLMRLNVASDLVLRAVKAGLTPFKSVVFSNFLQKKKKKKRKKKNHFQLIEIVVFTVPEHLHPSN